MRITEHLQKKAPDFGWFLVWDLNISDIFHNNKKVKLIASFPIITTELILSKIPGPFLGKMKPPSQLVSFLCLWRTWFVSYVCLSFGMKVGKWDNICIAIVIHERWRNGILTQDVIHCFYCLRLPLGQNFSLRRMNEILTYDEAF